MISLLLQNARHILRTRLLIVVLGFSLIVQFLGVRTLHSVTVQFEGVISPLDFKDALFIALLFQLFIGAFIAAVYGIWMAPYAHQGQRAALTFTLPVSKWFFPVSYLLTMLGLLVLEHGVMLVSYGVNFGFATFVRPDFPWRGLLLALLFETLAFEVAMFGFALAAMTVGQIPAFFLGGLVIFLLQIGGAIFRFDLEKFVGAGSLAQRIYDWLPPVGDLVFDLRHGYVKAASTSGHLGLWLLWLAFLFLLFRWKLRYPSASHAGET